MLHNRMEFGKAGVKYYLIFENNTPRVQIIRD